MQGSAQEQRDDRDWKQNLYERVVSDPGVQGTAWALAEHLREPEDPELNLADRQCARNYLKTCIQNSSVTELTMMTPPDFAAWWARGIIGACRYRSRRARPPVRER
jgi:hypothetical protein